MTVGGSCEVEVKSRIDEKAGVTVRGKLIIDIIETKGLKNIIFITANKSVEEMTRITSCLQKNDPITIMILHFDAFIEERSMSWPYKILKEPSLTGDMMYNMEIKEALEFTYFILPTMNYNLHEYTFRLIEGLRKVGIHSNLMIMYEPYRSVLYQWPRFSAPAFREILSDIYFYEPVDSTYDMYGICKFCSLVDKFGWDFIEEKPTTEIDAISNITYQNSWMVNEGFKYPLEFLPSFESNFHGKKLKINVEMHPTTIWFDKNIKAYVGPLYKDLMVLGEVMNFTLDFNSVKQPCLLLESTATSDLARRARDPAKSKEDFSMLKQGHIDIVGGDYIGSHEVSRDADITASMFYQAGANIVSVEPSKTFQWYAIFQPFKWYIWILILGSIPISGSALYLLRKYSDDPDKAAIWFDSIWDATVIACWDGIRAPYPPSAIIIFLSSYMLATFILINEYMGSFTSLMVTPSYVRPPIDSLEQLWKTNMTWLGGRMTDYYVDRFKNMTNIEARLKFIRPKENKPETLTAVSELLTRPDDMVYFERAGLMQWNVCHYGIDLNDRKLYYSHETIGDYSTFMYLKKHSFTTESFNRKILLLQDMGIIQYHQDLFNDEKMKRECKIEENDKIEMVTLFHISIGFYMLNGGFTLAMVSVFAEITAKFKLKLMRRDECAK